MDVLKQKRVWATVIVIAVAAPIAGFGWWLLSPLRTTACSKVWIFSNSKRQPTRKSPQTVPELHT